MLSQIIDQYPSDCGSYPYVKRSHFIDSDGNYEIREVQIKAGVTPEGDRYDFYELVTQLQDGSFTRFINYCTGQPSMYMEGNRP